MPILPLPPPSILCKHGRDTLVVYLSTPLGWATTRSFMMAHGTYGCS